MSSRKLLIPVWISSLLVDQSLKSSSTTLRNIKWWLSKWAPNSNWSVSARPLELVLLQDWMHLIPKKSVSAIPLQSKKSDHRKSPLSRKKTKIANLTLLFLEDLLRICSTILKELSMMVWMSIDASSRMEDSVDIWKYSLIAQK